MASGWAPDGAVQDQIDDSINDAVRLARSRLPSGPGEIHCQECGEEIPEARRRAMPGARLCVQCQSGMTGRRRPPPITGVAARTAS